MRGHKSRMQSDIGPGYPTVRRSTKDYAQCRRCGAALAAIRLADTSDVFVRAPHRDPGEDEKTWCHNTGAVLVE